jgi:hypothetical protein
MTATGTAHRHKRAASKTAMAEQASKHEVRTSRRRRDAELGELSRATGQPTLMPTSRRSAQRGRKKARHQGHGHHERSIDALEQAHKSHEHAHTHSTRVQHARRRRQQGQRSEPSTAHRRRGTGARSKDAATGSHQHCPPNADQRRNKRDMRDTRASTHLPRTCREKSNLG